MNARDLTALVHLVGFATGIMLYVMLGIMTRRRLSYVDASAGDSRGDALPLVTAMLGIVWNVGAMATYAVRDFAIGEPVPWVSAISYTALGFLPAVVVHSTINRTASHGYRWLLIPGYVGAVIAGVLHIAAAARNDMLSTAGLLLLTAIYAIVISILIVVERKRPGFQRSITAVALAAFAVSALHLSQHPRLVDAASWPVELIGHHASLPLVLAILYQDYRFAFADLFLKRALSLVALVVVIAVLYAAFAAPLVDPHAIAARSTSNNDTHLFSTATLLLLWIVTALAFPFIQRRVFRFVDRVILRRVDYRQLRVDLSTALARVADAESALQSVCELLSRALGASMVSWDEASSRAATHPTIILDARRATARVAVPTTIEPSYDVVIRDLRGGRTLLSDDLAFIEHAASTLGRRVDSLRLERERREREERERDALRLATEAELRALHAQLNPHFLFNALNTLGHLIQVAPDRGLATLYRLTGLLRAVLRRTNGNFVALREELEIVDAYLAIERERFEERLTVTIDVPNELREARIPPLVLQPLVENAMKHGIAPLRQGGSVTVRAERISEKSDGVTDVLRLSVIDTGRGMRPTAVHDRPGVGLANIKSRLSLYFSETASLSISATPGGGTTVELRVPYIEPSDAGRSSERLRVPASAG